MQSWPALDDSGVTFALFDRHGRLAAVRLIQEAGLTGPLAFARGKGTWRLSLPLPDVDRMEYLFEIEDHNGNRTTITDPGNPLRAGGAFGYKSVVEFPGYLSPAWLAADPVPGAETTLEFDAPLLDASVTAKVWSPGSLGAAERAPLLVVHDGPEYADLGRLTTYLGTLIASGALPPLRAALLGPGERNDWYSANPAYAQTLGETVLSELAKTAPATVRVGVGVSLGAVAMLHAHRTYPEVFDALLLQSGSFFTPELDPQESGFSAFAAVTAFVADIHAATHDPRPVPTVLTCGTVEENLANNAAMAATLQRLGYPVTFATTRDAHNYTAWRGLLDPHLTGLISDAVCARAA